MLKIPLGIIYTFHTLNLLTFVFYLLTYYILIFNFNIYGTLT